MEAVTSDEARFFEYICNIRTSREIDVARCVKQMARIFDFDDEISKATFASRFRRHAELSAKSKAKREYEGELAQIQFRISQDRASLSGWGFFSRATRARLRADKRAVRDLSQKIESESFDVDFQEIENKLGVLEYCAVNAETLVKDSKVKDSKNKKLARDFIQSIVGCGITALVLDFDHTLTRVHTTNFCHLGHGYQDQRDPESMRKATRRNFKPEDHFADADLLKDIIRECAKYQVGVYISSKQYSAIIDEALDMIGIEEDESGGGGLIKIYGGDHLSDKLRKMDHYEDFKYPTRRAGIYTMEQERLKRLGYARPARMVVLDDAFADEFNSQERREFPAIGIYCDREIEGVNHSMRFIKRCGLDFDEVSTLQRHFSILTPEIVERSFSCTTSTSRLPAAAAASSSGGALSSSASTTSRPVSAFFSAVV